MSPDKLQNLQSGANIAATAVGIGSTVAMTIAQVGDAKKRAQFQESLALLNANQQAELERVVQLSKDVNDRLKIITDAVAMIRVQEVKSKLEKPKDNNTKKVLLIIGGAFAILIGAVIVKIALK
jgi:hypothetical protein